MRAVTSLLIAMVTALLPTVSLALEGRDYLPGMEYSAVWSCQVLEKFNWYCEEEARPPPKPKEAAKPATSAKSKEEIAVEELEKIRKDLQPQGARAVVSVFLRRHSSLFQDQGPHPAMDPPPIRHDDPADQPGRGNH